MYYADIAHVLVTTSLGVWFYFTIMVDKVYTIAPFSLILCYWFFVNEVVALFSLLKVEAYALQDSILNYFVYVCPSLIYLVCEVKILLSVGSSVGLPLY